MSKVGLIILVFVSSLVVFVESQSCSSAEDCDDGECCYQGSCTTNTFICALKKRLKQRQRCYGDWVCTDGCCIDNKCKSKWSYECINKKSCFGNWECDSGCCKDNKCQETSALCYVPAPTTMASTRRVHQCYTSYDCYYGDGDCCVYGQCRSCDYYNPTTTTAEWQKTTDYPIDYDDYDYDGSSRRSRSGLSVGGSIGIAVAVIVVAIIKIALWASWCSRRQRVVVVRRRITCVAVPIVQNDELQREYERTAQGIPDCPPPAYSPRPFADDTQNTGENPAQTPGEGHGVSQGPPMGPPPEYSPSPAANPNENTNSVQTNLTQRAEITGNAEEMYGVPQGSTMVPPPPEYSFSPAANPRENTTGQNSAQTDQAQRREVTGNTEEMNGVSQGTTMGPFII